MIKPYAPGELGGVQLTFEDMLIVSESRQVKGSSVECKAKELDILNMFANQSKTFL